MKTSPLTRYLSFQFNIALKHMLKISQESDIEQLHKFRIALRKSRALLKFYMKEAYALQEILKVIAQQTNVLRELDVLLLAINKTDTPHLKKQIIKYRNQQFDELWYESFITNSTNALNQLYDEILHLNVKYSKEKLISKSLKYYNHTISRYHTIADDATDETFHDLRIEFKITRYTLEFISESSLQHEEEKIETCKHIQNYLGAVQDCSNQYEWLQFFYKKEPNTESKKLLKQYKKKLKQLKKNKVNSKAKEGALG